MDKELRDLYNTNNDIIFLLHIGSRIGWTQIKHQSLNRIIYLSKVLYSFIYEAEPNILDHYHFTSTPAGPISSIVNSSLIYLQSAEFIVTSDVGLSLEIAPGQIEKINDDTFDSVKAGKQEWLKAVMLLLGKYGENKVFSFVINDPLYKENTDSNSPKEIAFDSSENKTLQVLKNFKKSFEDSIEDTSTISKQEYLALYFDYIFSQIIR
ncbi:hypothetical protein [Pedobacter agri]|uniref:hypothetical protein n=1 Tax=Pedobacter agri TaxID=454586 RepID=UPI0029305CCF|nr:hypothetical protein [Pedobacter agri]